MPPITKLLRVIFTAILSKINIFPYLLNDAMKSDKNNSTASAVQVEANRLQQELNVHLHFRKRKCCYQCHVLKVIWNVALAVTVPEILKFQILTLKK